MRSLAAQDGATFDVQRIAAIVHQHGPLNGTKRVTRLDAEGRVISGARD
jgi:hypothetical protein